MDANTVYSIHYPIPFEIISVDLSGEEYNIWKKRA
jgi:hypothetical protein